jgi:1,2-diacylglycerol 3-alpha-glucosyltransferase
MKIGFFTDSYLPTVNGVSTSVDFTYKNLTKRGNTVYLVVPKVKNQKIEKNMSVICSIVANRAFNYRFALITPRIFVKLLKEDFDVIHGHPAGPISLMGLVIARIKKIPYVFTYHTMFMDYSHYIPFGLLSPKMIGKIVKKSCNGCDLIIAPSDKVKNECISQGIKKPIEVIPTGVEIERFNVSQKNFLRERFNLKKDDRILLHAGRLGKEKSVDFLIHAFKTIVKKDPKAHLIIVGTGPEMDNLKNLSQQLATSNNVHFAGLIEPKNMPLVYNGAEVFVFSSTTETQGLVVLEAMASGLPIVAVKDEAVMETLENNVEGILVEKNTTDFAEKVLELLDNERERGRLGANAKKKAISISRESIDKLERAYEKLISKTSI